MKGAQEAERLRSCASLAAGREASWNAGALLGEAIDVERLFDASRRHGLLPLLYRHLRARWPDTLEPTALEMLHSEFHCTARRNLTMTQELLEILELFEKNDVPALPYKGPVLAACEYGNLALRPFCDLDILVPKRHVQRAKELLLARGYVPEHRLSPGHEAAWMRARNDVNLRRPDLDIVVELHWEVVTRRLCVAFDEHQLWEQTRTVSIGGHEVRTLTPENLLLVLCVHGAKHGWTRLIWVCDIAALVANHGDLDWASVISDARRLGIKRMLGVSLRLASDLAGCELREQVRQLVEDRATTRLAQDVRERLFAEGSGDHSAFRRSLFHVRIRERVRDKIRFCMYTAIVPSAADRLLVGFPQYLAILYYVLRPFRLARKYRRGLMASTAVTR